MANKLRIAFIIFAGVVSILFCVFVVLMTTVNPPREQRENSNDTSDPATDKATEASDSRIMEYFTSDDDQVSENVTQVLKERRSIGDSRSTKDGGVVVMRVVDYDDQVSENVTQVLKERRSIGDSRSTKDGGVVVMRVVDHEGRPRIELVMYPNNPSNWKIYKVDSIPGPNHSEFELQRTALMPEDTIVVQNEVSSHNSEYELDSSEGSKTVETNKVKMLNSDQEVTRADIIIPSTKENTIIFEDSTKTVDRVLSIDSEEKPADFTEKQSTVAALDIVPRSHDNIWKSDSIEATRMPDKNIIIETNVNTATDSITVTSITQKARNHTAKDLITRAVVRENVSRETKEISDVTPFEVIFDNNYTDVTEKITAIELMIDENVNKATNSSNSNIETETKTSNELQATEPLIIWKDFVNDSSTTNNFNKPDLYTIPYSKTDEGGSQASSEPSKVLEDNSGYISTYSTIKVVSAIPTSDHDSNNATAT